VTGCGGFRVFVIDTCAVIGLKRLPRDDQWDCLQQLRLLVEQGRVAFPRQVVSELNNFKFTDTPGAWINSAKTVVQHDEPSDDALRTVLAAAPDLLEPDAAEDVADPYVAAMALDLRASGFDAVVVTEDVVDRLPLKLSLKTACARLGLPHAHLADLLAWVEAAPSETLWDERVAPSHES
jgi:hypothetical protein